MNTSAKNTARATATERDARWTSVVARAPQAWYVLLLGPDHRCVLPAVVRGTSRKTGACEVSCDMPGSGAGGIPSVQAVQAGPGLSSRTARRQHCANLPAHRRVGRGA